MEKVIGILYNANFNESSFVSGCGGSETWVIQISKEFVRHGYHVIVFCNCESWYFSESEVEYIPLEYFDSRIKYQNFDYFIFVRSLDEYYDIFVENNPCENIYLQSHDMFIWMNGLYVEKFNYDSIYNRFDKVKKFVALTNFHKEELNAYNKIPYEKIEVIGNGLDSDIFTSVDNDKIEKDNEILWTTAFGRGGNLLTDYILPIVKQVIPEFKVNICGYGDNVPEEIKNNPNVNFLGTLNKTEYYKEFKKHKVWFLPCTVVEDFGICAAEAVMCGAHVVSPYLHGMKDVLSPFTPFAMTNKYNVKEPNGYHYSKYELEMPFDDFQKTNVEAAYSIINIIQNYDNPFMKKLVEAQKKYVLETHNWNNVVNKWISLFESK